MKKLKIDIFGSKNKKIRLVPLQPEKLIYDDNLWLKKKIVTNGIIYTKEFEIKEGEIYRFGREIIKIEKINLINDKKKHEINLESLNNEIILKNDVLQQEDDEKISELNCRICLETESEDNPFEENICKCSLHIPAHIKCLLKWMEKKYKTKKGNGIFFYDFTKLFCDICREKYPTKIRLKDRKINIIKIKENLQKNFIIISIYDKKRNYKHIKGQYYIEPKKGKSVFKIGRFSQSDIFLQDTSVSRHHAFLEFYQKRFFIFDKKSKFGTLKKICEPMDLVFFQDRNIILDKFSFIFHIYPDKLKNCSCGLKTKNLFKNKISHNIRFKEVSSFQKNKNRKKKVEVVKQNKNMIEEDKKTLERNLKKPKEFKRDLKEKEKLKKKKIDNDGRIQKINQDENNIKDSDEIDSEEELNRIKKSLNNFPPYNEFNSQENQIIIKKNLNNYKTNQNNNFITSHQNYKFNSRIENKIIERKNQNNYRTHQNNNFISSHQNRIIKKNNIDNSLNNDIFSQISPEESDLNFKNDDSSEYEF